MTAAAVVFEAHPLADSWRSFLSRYHWDWFCTFTFRDKPLQPGERVAVRPRWHAEAADKLFRLWVGELNRSLYGRRWYLHPEAGVYWVRALEWQKREVLHYHALLGDVTDLNSSAKRLYWMDRWNELAGFAKIEVPRKRGFVAAYVSKYVAKGGEIDVSANLRSYAVQIAALPMRSDERGNAPTS
jgi:hypothetical protein